MRHPFAARLDDVLDHLSALGVGEQAATISFHVEAARELNRVNETIIAMENLCDNLAELPRVTLTAKVAQEIIDLAHAMGLRSGYEHVLTLVPTDP